MRSCLTKLFTLLCVLLTASCLTAQVEVTPEPISLRNPSFEDMPRNSAAPRGWIDCSFYGETPVDVHPDPRFEFRVAHQAQHGKTYLGMVTRENETYEGVSQLLSRPMVGGQCYELSLQMARSDTYLSRSRRTNLPANYVTPVILRVFGGYSICGTVEKLGESEIVTNYHWEEYRIKLEPELDYTHIRLEVYYKPQSMLPYNGNILLDNAQPLQPIPCDQDMSLPREILTPPVAEYADPDADIVTKPVIPRPEPTPPPTPAEPEEPKVKLGTTTAALTEGQIFKIENITFHANSADLAEESEEALREIINFLEVNDDVIIEVGGHASSKASTDFANELSTERARAVIKYLLHRRIDNDRMFPKGYGKTRPVCLTDSPECNTRNQRVEIKILRLSR